MKKGVLDHLVFKNNNQILKFTCNSREKKSEQKRRLHRQTCKTQADSYQKLIAAPPPNSTRRLPISAGKVHYKPCIPPNLISWYCGNSKKLQMLSEKICAI